MMLYAIGMVVDQTLKDGFRFRNVDEIAEIRAASAGIYTAGPIPGLDEKRAASIVSDEEKNVGRAEQREGVQQR